MCLGSLPRYMTLFGTNFTCWTDSLTFNSTILWLWSLWSTHCKEHRSSGCNTSSNTPHPPLSPHHWCKVLGLVYLVFSKCGAMHYGQTSILWCHVWRTLFQKYCGLFRCDFANLICAAMFSLERRHCSSSLVKKKKRERKRKKKRPYLSFFVPSNMLTEVCRGH